jgi:uncharacterized protein
MIAHSTHPLNRRLHLILMPTEACNFRCVYCYERFEHHRMKPPVVRGVLNLMTRRAPQLDRLGLSWFGGEPLLARGVIEEVMLHAQSLARRFEGLTLTGNVTTNAYLLDRACFGRLLDLGVTHYQIAFDGPPEHHDRKRVLAGGKGTFDRIWKNVLAMREVNRTFEALIRVHVDRENADAMPAFIHRYREALGQDGRFRIFIRPLSRLGGPRDAALPILDAAEAARILPDLHAQAHPLERGGQPGLQPLALSGVCYASMPHSFLVRADGRLNKCTVALDHPNNQIGCLREDGTMVLDSSKVSPWIRGLISGDEGELQCPMEGYADASKTPSAGTIGLSLRA